MPEDFETEIETEVEVVAETEAEVETEIEVATVVETETETETPAIPTSFGTVTDRLAEIAEVMEDETMPLDDALDLLEEAVALGMQASSLLETDMHERDAADEAAQEAEATEEDAAEEAGAMAPETAEAAEGNEMVSAE